MLDTYELCTPEFALAQATGLQQQATGGDWVEWVPGTTGLHFDQFSSRLPIFNATDQSQSELEPPGGEREQYCGGAGHPGRCCAPGRDCGTLVWPLPCLSGALAFCFTFPFMQLGCLASM